MDGLKQQHTEFERKIQYAVLHTARHMWLHAIIMRYDYILSVHMDRSFVIRSFAVSWVQYAFASVRE